MHTQPRPQQTAAIQAALNASARVSAVPSGAAELPGEAGNTTLAKAVASKLA